jgi:uncharacterized Fe-S cluster-containing protein
MSDLTMKKVDQVQDAIERALEREGCDSDTGCSALANALLTALVKLKRDPRVADNVKEEMRRLAAKLVELAGGDTSGLERIILDPRRFH